jgi:hypothetical protein
MAERTPYIWSELFLGNWNLFKKVLQNPETVFVYDVDGLLINTSKMVIERFNEKNNTDINPVNIDDWNYLSNYAKSAGLAKDVIEHAEDDYYDPDLLLTARRFLYMRPVVQKTVRYYGADRNFVLTSRNPNLRDSTISLLSREFPEFKTENIFIRNGHEQVGVVDFKTRNLKELAKKAPYVVFVDDSVEFTRAAINTDMPNCLVVNIPQGKVMPDFRDERLIIIKHFPNEIQAMYPLLDSINRAIDGR